MLDLLDPQDYRVISSPPVKGVETNCEMRISSQYSKYFMKRAL